MDQITKGRYDQLQQYLAQIGSLAVAFSGGVDSTLLLAVAHRVLGDNALAITNVAANIPACEAARARAFCRKEGIVQVETHIDPLASKAFASNPPDRCYICKTEVFTAIKEVAAERGIAHVCDGTNADDAKAYRPGMKALEELGIESPLLDAGLTKAQIREVSRELGLASWDLPSCSCLATRFPYGTRLTSQDLARVDAAEDVLRAQGLSQVRVRVHGEVARIELLPQEMPLLMEPENRTQVAFRLRDLGFPYVTLDLDGFRSGSMDAPRAGS